MDMTEILSGPSEAVLQALYGDLPLDTPTKIAENDDVAAWITRHPEGLLGELRPKPGGRTANREALEANFQTFITGAAAALANMQAIIDTPQVAVANLAALQALQAQVKQSATTTQNLIRKTVALARYVSDNVASIENT